MAGHDIARREIQAEKREKKGGIWEISDTQEAICQ